MSENLKEFKVENTFQKKKKVYFQGKLDETSTLVQLALPRMDKSFFQNLKEIPHNLQMKNDVYETATVNFNLKCGINIEESAASTIIEIPSFEYAKESYSEYVSSEVNQLNMPESCQTIYENDEYIISSLDADNLSWVCVFKDLKINSIRELTNPSLLIDLKIKIKGLLADKGDTLASTCMYFDYKGKSSSLILHITSISDGIHNIRSTGKFIYFDSLLKNISIDPEYYQNDIFYIRKSKK